MPKPRETYYDVSFEPEHICTAQPGYRAVFRTKQGDYFAAPVVAWATGQRVSTQMRHVRDEKGETISIDETGTVERERRAFGLIMVEGYSLGCPESEDCFRGYAGPGEPFE